jgi:NADPH-dependent curcumin reductase CurA
MSGNENRRFVLCERPVGDFEPRILRRVVEPLPKLAAGQALVRNRYLSIDPGSRIWMGEGESYSEPVPLGEVMRGVGIGEVVASNTSKYRVGSRVFGLLGWQDYALISPDDAPPCRALPRFLPVPMTTLLGVLGPTGMTAYFGVMEIGRPRRGETVVVSAAAGAVGSIAGQIAKLRGARVVGIAGSREKCAWLVDELGFDAAICRRDDDWRAQLAAACPDGIDVDFENVGGEVMEAVFELLNQDARVVLCGLISQYGEGGPARGPKNFVNLLTRRVRLQGFIVLDFVPRFPAAMLRLAGWLLRGKLKHRHTLIRGLDQAPQALVQLFQGQNVGKLIVEIPEPHAER